jgi:HD-GYP domain-containing protein (c-di-GMP phosphodiesterase class II)
MLAMRLAEALGIGDRERSSLFYAALLHEADGRADLVRQAGLSSEVESGIAAIHERWDGRGSPYRLSGEAIPLLGRILAVCHELDAASAGGGAQRAMETIHAGSGSAYDPALTDVLLALCSHGLLAEAADPERYRTISDLEPNWLARMADADEAQRFMALAASMRAARR